MARTWLGIGVALLCCAAAAAEDPDNCLLCHQYRGLGRYIPEDDAVHLYSVSAEFQHQRLGAHARLGCTDCHPRDEVGVIPHETVSRVDCTRTCHISNPDGVQQTFSHQNVEQILARSIHTPDTLSKLEFQDGPLLGEGQSSCLYCHDEQLFRSLHDVIPLAEHMGVHALDRCETCHAEQIPVDTQFYLRHVASRVLHARPPLEMMQSCSVCHSDPKIRQDYRLEDASVGFVKSFHGKAALLGAKDAADCIDCHVLEGANDHLILAQRDPQSSINSNHKADSCRSLNCHPGADVSFGQAAVHFDIPTLGSWELVLAVGFVFFTMLTFGPSLVLTLLELLQVVIGRVAHGEHRIRALAEKVLEHPQGKAKLRRFTPWQRIQHWILALLFALLVLTGFPMKFADQAWARQVVELLGGLGNARFVHHWAGIGLVVGFVFHITQVAFLAVWRAGIPGRDGKAPGLIGSIINLPMFVGPKDFVKGRQLMAYLFGFRKSPPEFGRFSLDQKFEYLGVFWGTMLLGVTGMLLWGAQYASQYVGGRVFNLALIAHTYEAFLAAIHVGILHVCNVTLAPSVFPLSPATLTGDTPVARLAEVHGEQVEEVARDLGIVTGGGYASHG